MEEPRAQLQFRGNDEILPASAGRAVWVGVRRPRRGRSLAAVVEERGPYEASYTIQNGYPDREIFLP